MAKKPVKRTASQSEKSTSGKTARADGAAKAKGDKPAKGAASPESKQTSKKNARTVDEQTTTDVESLLVTQIDTIKKLWAAADTNDVMARYEIAVECHRIRDAGKYGAKAVETAADELKLATATIHAYASVARVWSEQVAFVYLAKKLCVHGRPLSWSHFLELAAVSDVRKRNSLLTKALKEGWSVDELQKQIRTDRSTTKSAASNETAAGEGKQTAASANELVGVTKELTETFRARLPNVIKHAKPQDIEAGIQALETHGKQIDEYISQLKEQKKLNAKKHSALKKAA